VDFLNTRKKYEVLEILDFDSTRKRMSIILRDLDSNKILLYCKGAEQFVLKKCISGDFNQCLADIQRFGEQGWRTLALSFKYLSESEYRDIKVNQ
jgi:phospholipid-translocating ATPase